MLEDESPSTQTQLGLVLLALGKYEDPLTSLNRAIELDPKFYAAYGNRGIAHSRIGETDLALADYDQEIELNPDYVLAYSSRGSAYLLLGESELAMADLDWTIELDRIGSGKRIGLREPWRGPCVGRRADPGGGRLYKSDPC